MGYLKNILLVFNPHSGVRNFPGRLFDVVDKFTASGFLVTVYPTQSPGEVNEIIASYAVNYHCVVCSGGDGTIGEAVNALLSFEKPPTLGIIPSGTVNDFAASLGIPKDIRRAANLIVNGVPNEFDIGRFGDKYFSYVAAFGMFTDVPYATPQNIKNLLGKLAYFLEGVRRFVSAGPSHCVITLDGEKFSGDYILGIIGNARFIAGIKLPKEMGAQMDDGLFEVILIRQPKTLKDQQEIISSLLTHEEKTDLLVMRKAKKIAFESAEPVAWTLDGDFGGKYAEIKIENLHRSLKIITPPKERQKPKTNKGLLE